jgi:hypothetical protein
MASVFYDSFDPYSGPVTLKWASGEASFNSDPAFVRTGTQSLNPAGGAGELIPRINFTNRTTMIAGVAYYQTDAVGNQIMYFFNALAAAGVYGECDVSSDGAIVLKVSNSTVATSAPGIIGTGQFYYVEMKATFTDPGHCEIRVNGETVLVYDGFMSDGVNNGVVSFFLPGSSINTCYYDDLYVLDDTGDTNNDFLGAINIYAILPDEDEAPLDWTPLAGTNVSQVNIAPPPGDSDYVFSPTVGAIDQYHYPITGIPGTYLIKAIQHGLCARLDAAGSHTLQSQLNGTTGQLALVGSNTPTEEYAYVLCPYDTNPNTGEAFQPTDFATTFLGPIITA